MATIHVTPEGRINVIDPDVSLSSIQVRTIMMCLHQPKSYYDVVQEIRSEPELSLLPEPTISKDVANLAARGFVVVDLEN